MIKKMIFLFLVFFISERTIAYDSIPKSAKIYLCGHEGLLGSAVGRVLKKRGYSNVVTCPFKDLDLRNQNATNRFFEKHKPEYVYLIAGKAGGIRTSLENPVDFTYDNAAIACNVIRASHEHGVKKLLFISTACLYPEICPQPMKEEYILSGKLEPANEGYALAKALGTILCEAYNKQYGTRFISCMPPNLYGINDSCDPETAHVVPALMVRFCQAKDMKAEKTVVWGTGNARRELLFADDLADALLFLMDYYEGTAPINIGVGEDVSIRELAETIKKVVGFEGELVFDATKPEGTPGKLLDSTRINQLGWKPKTSLEDGIQKIVYWYRSTLRQLCS